MDSSNIIYSLGEYAKLRENSVKVNKYQKEKFWQQFSGNFFAFEFIGLIKEYFKKIFCVNIHKNKKAPVYTRSDTEASKKDRGAKKGGEQLGKLPKKRQGHPRGREQQRYGRSLILLILIPPDHDNGRVRTAWT